ncbi:MAG TPA: isomerizing glutamine--fructose-6-phosphate transaminase, partial [Candidatus Babeliales bacterium]|nr:isomerizing glutamine--fructose-6-phosphate transaminase [Candidatus Babeliales bacterium]
MCSIIGYIGSDKAAPVLVQGLKRMEYRGYDSVGIATFSDNQILIKKGVGKVDQVNNASKLDTLSGNIGIGHTRWATHGGVTSANAHPHSSSSSKIAIVHNGIIDNFTELKKDLQQKGFLFKSETDSEVIANLLQYEFDQTKNVKKSMLQTVGQLAGNYSFVAVFNDGMIAAARFHEPLIVGIGKEGYFVSSDVLGFVGHTDQVIYPDNREFVIINTRGIQMFDFDGNPVRHQITKISKEFADSYKGEYAHYTIKEISEQPRTILKAGHNTKIELDLVANLIKQAKNLYITGSGTSYNAALVAKHIFSKYAKLKIESLISSEIPYSPNFFDNQSILIALSQSGESADVLESVNIAQNDGTKIISIVNMMTSSLANMSSISIGLNCGPEIGVA